MAFNLQQASGLNFAAPTAAAGLMVTGLSGAATTHSTPAMLYAVSGVPNFKAAAPGAATPTTDGNTGGAITLTASRSRVLVWAVSSAGTTTLFAGPSVAWPNVTGTATGSPLPLEYPSIPPGFAVIAVVVLSAGSGLSGTFTVGSSNWNTGGMVIGTVVSCAGYLPNTVQVTP